VTNVEETRSILGRTRVRVTLAVQPDGEQEFEVVKTIKGSAGQTPQLGETVPVAYDPDDRDDVELLEGAAAPAATPAPAPAPAIVAGNPQFEQTLRQALAAKGVTGALQDEAVAKALAAIASGGHVVDLTEYTRAHGEHRDPAERLEILTKLRDAGALSPAEFEQAKAKILEES